MNRRNTLTSAFLALLITGGGAWAAGQVDTIQIKTSVNDLDFGGGGQTVTGLPTPSGSTDAATKGYVDTQVAASSAPADFKASVRLATAAALPANTPAGSGVGATLTADANGALSVDGVAVAASDRILVKDEGSADNGVYTVTDTGDGSNPFVLTRATDFDEDSEVTASLTVAVEEGSTLADRVFQLTTNDPITVDTTTLAFARYDGTAGSTGSVTTIQPDDAAAAGSSGDFAPIDHTHAIVADTAGTIQPDDAAAEGSSTSFSRADHTHAIASGAPGNVGTANAEGTSTGFARDDHTHDSPTWTDADKDVTAAATTVTNTSLGNPIANTPALGSAPIVCVNALCGYTVGDGVDTADVYFAATGGSCATPRALTAIVATDDLCRGDAFPHDTTTSDTTSIIYPTFTNN